MSKVTRPLPPLYELEKACEFIHQGDRFLVVSHVQPDGDAISSTLAVGLMLRALGKSYTMVNADTMPDKFDYLEGFDQIRLANQPPDDDEALFDRVIAVDCADFARIGKASQWFAAEVQLLNIDHHPTNDGYGQVRLIQPEAAATAEILYTLAEALHISWNQALADCIYTGLLTDTGGFRYANTSKQVMQVASHMLAHGTNGHHLAELLLERMSYAHILLVKRALSSLAFTADQRVAWISITVQDMNETKARNEDLEGLVNYPRNVEGVEVGILFKEVDESKVKVSMRSTGLIDVAAFAKSIGGGGHVRAAGCTVHKPLAEAVPYIIDQISRLFP